MIYLGCTEAEKLSIVNDYCRKHGLTHVVCVSPKQVPLSLPNADNVEFADTIEYVTFYRLREEIDNQTLVVLSECLRSQNRYELVYNVQRMFLSQTEHRLIFNYLPQIDTRDDFMILFDFDTGSRWKHRRWDINLILDNAQVTARPPLPITFNRIPVPTSSATKKRYAEEKRRRFADLGTRDPHTLPRNLYMIGGKDKLAYIDRQSEMQMSLFGDRVDSRRLYVARNQRLRRENVVSYDTAAPANEPYTIIEFPHRFVDFGEFMKRTGQHQFDVLTAELKVDDWYWQRYSDWKERVHETCTDILA